MGESLQKLENRGLRNPFRLIASSRKAIAKIASVGNGPRVNPHGGKKTMGKKGKTDILRAKTKFDSLHIEILEKGGDRGGKKGGARSLRKKGRLNASHCDRGKKWQESANLICIPNPCLKLRRDCKKGLLNRRSPWGGGGGSTCKTAVYFAGDESKSPCGHRKTSDVEERENGTCGGKNEENLRKNPFVEVNRASPALLKGRR